MSTSAPVTGVAHASIRPPGRWDLPGAADARELWQARNLLRQLVWRDIRVRYAQTVLGAAWTLLQPLATVGIFSLVFGIFAPIPTGAVPYALVALTGLVPWTYFATAVAASSDSLVASRDLLTKIYFPRLVIPLTPILAGLADLAIGLLVLVLGVIIWGTAPMTIAVLLLPAPLLVMVLAATGIGALATALNVQYRDIRYVIPFMVQIGLFLSPVIYPLAVVPEKLRLVLALNPMTGVIEAMRGILLQSGHVPWDVFAVSTLAAVAAAVAGVLYFRRVEQRFADVV